MKIVSIANLYILFIFNLSLAQSTIQLNGHIIESKTQEPIPFAHIVISGTTIGTISNYSGAFSIKVPHELLTRGIIVSCIGYESKSYKITDFTNKKEPISIALKSDIKTLSVVTITPNNVALKLVERAISKIGNNYPISKTQLEGFLRATMRKGDSIAYVVEGVYLVEKTSYQKGSNKGKIKLIKGRAVEVIELKYSWYGGHYLPHFGDIVHSRRSFINESKTKQYYYDILDSLLYDGDTIVRVGFQSKNQKGKGMLFINLKDYAFIKITYYYNGDENEDTLLDKIRGTNRLYRTYNIEYKKVDSRWYLNFVEYKSAMSFQKEKDTLNWTSVFTTTKIRDSLELIEYQDQFQYGDITLRNMGEYDSSFWQNYNIVLPSKEEEALFAANDPAAILSKANAQEKTLSKRKKLLKQISKFKVTLGLFVQPASINEVVMNYTNASTIITATIPNSDFFYYGLSSAIEYYFSPSFFVGYDGKSSFGGNKYSSATLKTGYNRKFTVFGRPASANFSVNVGYYQFGYVVGTYSVASDLEINNKKFDSGEVQLSLESRRWSVEPTLRLSLEMNHRLSLFTEGGWNMPFSTTDGLYFKEKGQPFWKTKKTFVGLPDPTISFTDGTTELTEIPLNTNLMLNAGVLIQFK